MQGEEQIGQLCAYSNQRRASALPTIRSRGATITGKGKKRRREIFQPVKKTVNTKRGGGEPHYFVRRGIQYLSEKTRCRKKKRKELEAGSPLM